jgi:ABC-type dipeptide/oligopeptide/nickel transport system permease subunit
VLSTLEGTLITLANTAPWLIVGTVLGLIVAFSRGMWDNIRTLRKDLRGDPIRRTN